MRIIPAALIALVLATPTIAGAQGVSVQAAAGPTTRDPGYSVAAGIGFSPISRLTILANIEHSYQPSQVTSYPGGVSYFRGGSVTLGTAEVRASLFGRDRISPYGLVGFGTGRARPNVDATFPMRSESDVVSPFAGGGLHVPLGDHLLLFGDWRLMLVIGREADNLSALGPVRAGLSWKF